MIQATLTYENGKEEVIKGAKRYECTDSILVIVFDDKDVIYHLTNMKIAKVEAFELKEGENN